MRHFQSSLHSRCSHAVLPYHAILLGDLLAAHDHTVHAILASIHLPDYQHVEEITGCNFACDVRLRSGLPALCS